MGNQKCKQCHSSVFEDEEDEETWFEWMESTSERSQKCVSPRTHPLPVQPLAFHTDMLDRSKSTRSKPPLYFFTDGNVLKGLHKASSENESISEEPAVRIENNNSPRKSGRKVVVEEEATYSPIFPDFPAGEVNVSLSFDKNTSRLRVSIVKARNLCCKVREGKRQDKCGVSCSDLYIVVSLMRGQSTLQSHRTAKKKGCTDILIYENYSFDLTSLDLNELTLRLIAMHCCKHVINTDHVIGQVDTDDRTSETSFGCHWLEVITSSRRSVNKWHTLWC